MLHTLNEKVESMERKIVSTNNSMIEKRLGALEEKVDRICEHVNTEKETARDSNSIKQLEMKIDSLQDMSKQQERKTNEMLMQDSVKFIDTIIDLTSKISGLESKFENHEKNVRVKEQSNTNTSQDVENEKMEIRVETSNKFEILQDMQENSKTVEKNSDEMVSKKQE